MQNASRGTVSVPSVTWNPPTRHWLGQPYPEVFSLGGFRGCRWKLKRPFFISLALEPSRLFTPAESPPWPS